MRHRSIAIIAFWLAMPLMASAQHNYSLLLSQYSGSESYDPFADYSEFDSSVDEEEDINFFKNGRFVNLGLLLGQESFTGQMGSIYSSGSSIGVYISYFFNLRFALHLGYRTADHQFRIQNSTESIEGNVSLNSIDLNLKYHFNTQNVTRGLASFNPYGVLGLSQIHRTFTLVNNIHSGRDGAMAFNLGAGSEFPILNNSSFIGLEFMYRIINFPDENREIEFESGAPTGYYPRGDITTLYLIFGINF